MAELPEVQLMEAQAEFLLDDTTPFLGLMGGYRAGKTYIACLKSIRLASKNVGRNGMMMEPTASLLDGVLAPQMIECLDKAGFVYRKTYDYYSTAVNPRFILRFPTGNVTIFLRASENWQRIVGLNLAYYVADEFDTSGYDVCNQAWQKMTARLTKGSPLQGCVLSTKEGFQWCYKFFVEDAERLEREHHEKNKQLIAKGLPPVLWVPDRRMIDINVRDNPYVDEGYIELQRSQLSPKQFEAFIENKFVNFTTGSVYYCYDRVNNKTTFTLQQRPQEYLYIGIDFNVGKMAAIVAMMDGSGKLFVVDEIFGCSNTMALVAKIKERYPGRYVQLYVDGSGNAEKTNSSQTDVHILRQNFGEDNVFFRAKHLLVVDRVGSVNARFLAADGKTRMLFVNDVTCPLLTKCLEAQGYVNGKPDKANDVDHLPDALGYLVSYKFPILGREPSVTVVSG